MRAKIVFTGLLALFLLSLSAMPVLAADVTGSTVMSVNLGNGNIDPQVVVSDGKVFAVTTGSYNYTTYAYDEMPKVYCLSTSGDIIWSTTINGGGWQLAAPVVNDGLVIVPSTDGTVYALSESNGSIQWTYSLPFSYVGGTSTPLVYEDQIIIASGDGSIVSLNLTGQEQWTTKIASEIYFSSPVAKNGLIYIGSEDKKLYAVYANGSGEAWNITLPGVVRSTPLLLDDEIVVNYAVYSNYVAIDGAVTAISYAGHQLWTVSVNATSTSPVEAKNGISVTSVTGVWLISDNGTVEWHNDIGVVKGSAAATDQGLYVVSYTSPACAYLLDNSGNVVFNRTLSPSAYSMNTPTVADGNVYIGSDNGYVYALKAAGEKNSDMIYIVGIVMLLIVLVAIAGMVISRRKK